MAKYGGASVGFVLVDGYDLLPSVIQNLDGPNPEAVLVESHGLGVSFAEVTAPGIRRFDMNLEGFWSDAAADINAALAGNESASRVITIALHGNTQAAKADQYAGGFGAKWRRIAKVADLVRASASFSGSGQYDLDAVILRALGASTADVTGTAVDNAASSAGGYTAHAHVTAFSGFTNAILKIQSSPDNSAWSDLVTFTTFTGIGAERKTAAGSVPRYLRAFLDVTGTGSVSWAITLKRL